MKKFWHVFVTILLLQAVRETSVYAVGNLTGVELSARFYDQRIYYVKDDPVMVRVTLTNTGQTPYRFRLAEDRAFSLDVEVVTLQNIALERAIGLIRKRSESRQVFFREVVLDPGESLSIIEDVCDYAEIESAGTYVVRVKLYPEILKDNGNDEVIISNRLQLRVRPSKIYDADGIPVALEVDTGANLARQKIPPDEVVEWTIGARQKTQWEKFFLYLNLESMLSRDSASTRKWKAESEEGRKRMVARYKSELSSDITDNDISMIPFDYTIERTAYNTSNAEVTVLEKFKVGQYTELKRFVYYLIRTDGIWEISDYSVVNLGTE
jgi:hypothetical protein